MEIDPIEREHPLRRARTFAKLTQEQLASELEVTQALLSLVETGKARLGTKTALRIADHPEMRKAMVSQGITVEDLLRGERA